MSLGDSSLEENGVQSLLLCLQFSSVRFTVSQVAVWTLVLCHESKTHLWESRRREPGVDDRFYLIVHDLNGDRDLFYTPCYQEFRNLQSVTSGHPLFPSLTPTGFHCRSDPTPLPLDTNSSTSTPDLSSSSTPTNTGSLGHCKWVCDDGVGARPHPPCKRGLPDDHSLLSWWYLSL